MLSLKNVELILGMHGMGNSFLLVCMLFQAVEYDRPLIIIIFLVSHLLAFLARLHEYI